MDSASSGTRRTGRTAGKFIANINHYTLAITFLPDRTIEVGANEASGSIRNGTLVGTPR